MRHRVAGKRLGRTTSHRRAMRRNMATSLFQHEAIRTTAPKAKELRSFVDRMITLAKKGTLHARRQVIAELTDRALVDEEGDKLEQTVVQKLFDEIAPRYANRAGGYTRIIRLAERRIGDAGKQVLMQLLGEDEAEISSATGASKRQQRAAKRHDAAAAVKETVEETPAAEEAAEAPAETTDEAETAEDAAEEATDETEEKTE